MSGVPRVLGAESRSIGDLPAQCSFPSLRTSPEAMFSVQRVPSWRMYTELVWSKQGLFILLIFGASQVSSGLASGSALRELSQAGLRLFCLHGPRTGFSWCNQERAQRVPGPGGLGLSASGFLPARGCGSVIKHLPDRRQTWVPSLAWQKQNRVAVPTLGFPECPPGNRQSHAGIWPGPGDGVRGFQWCPGLRGLRRVQRGGAPQSRGPLAWTWPSVIIVQSVVQRLAWARAQDRGCAAGWGSWGPHAGGGAVQDVWALLSSALPAWSLLARKVGPSVHRKSTRGLLCPRQLDLQTGPER